MFRGSGLGDRLVGGSYRESENGASKSPSFFRAERTPEAVAVSQGIRSNARAAPKKVALAPCQTNLSPLPPELPFGKSQLFLNELPDKDGVGDTFPGSLSLKSGKQLIRQPDSDGCCASSFCHSVLHYDHACEKSQPGGYLEPLAKRSVDLDLIFKTKCPGYWVQGNCANGHRYAKELYCGREWCEVCGAEWSAAHQRRFARWISKATQILSLGYFVFTIPEELRPKFRTKEALARLGHQVQELLKSYGYSRGLRRWHFFGDRSTRWHPHLNILVDGGYLSPEKLELIKVAYAGILGCQVVDVNYRYRRSPGEKVHTLKYVTRATFRDYKLDPRMALELRGFRNQLWWGSGKWDREPVWSLDDLRGPAKQDLGELDARAVESLESGTCPACGQPLDWSRVQPISTLMAEKNKRFLGAGYWELPPVRPPPALPAEVKTRLYWLELMHRVDVELAQERAESRAKAEAEEYQGWWAGLLNEN
ncbi:hypothetical protein ES703_57036 [subsurface metagenome]